MALVAAGRMGTSIFSFLLADGTRVIMDGSVAGPSTKGVRFPPRHHRHSRGSAYLSTKLQFGLDPVGAELVG
ncbi:hypothetical protein BJX65DRAFT_277010 [Aspergillus insuetus]